MTYDELLRLDVPHDELIRAYLPLCARLMYEGEATIRAVTGKLTASMRVFARRHSMFYRSLDKIGVIDKPMLYDGSRWHVPGYRGKAMSTRGTTSGSGFNYLSWEDVFNVVEGEFHYGAALDEFGLGERPQIVFMLFQHPFGSSPHVGRVIDSPRSPLHSHGGRNSVVHVVDREPPKDSSHEDYYRRLFDYVLPKPIDVILTSGPVINSIAYYARKFGVRGRLCKLLSNTCEPLKVQDAASLKELGLIDDWCDHMRCWDGGASFLTCKHGRYHLLDNLSWCRSVEGRLVSTDYFSLPSPFVNYWNGDHAEIGDVYERCECGRAYRDFRFVRPRDFYYSGLTSDEIKKRIKSTGATGVKYVKCYERHLEITTKWDLPQNYKNAIVEALPQVKKVTFMIEST